MRTTMLSLLLLLWLPAVSVFVNAADDVDTRLIEDLGPLAPSNASCALDCLNKILASTCNSSSLTSSCLCDAQVTQADYFRCFRASCPAKDAFAVQNLAVATCGWPVRDDSTLYTALSMSFTILANSIIIARLVFNCFFSIRGFNMADWAILVAVVVKTGLDTINYLGIYKHGLGKDIWTFTPAEVTEFVFYVWIGVQSYVIMMTFVKVVLCLFLLSLFSGCRLRRLLWATVVVHLLAGITFSLLGVFTCTPVDYYWTRYSTASKGHCINRLASYMSNGAFTVASDIWLLAIPMTQLYKLKLQWKKKINAGIMFLLGFIGTIFSIVRFRAIPGCVTSINPTRDQAEQGLFAELEINVGLICACLPSIRLMLAHLFPSVFASDDHRRASGTACTGAPSFQKSAAYVEMEDVTSPPSVRLR